MYFEDSLIYIEPLVINDEIDFNRHELRRRGRYVMYDKETCRYSDESEFARKELPDNSYYVDFVTAEAFDSPFIHASPFVVKDGNLYAVSAETGAKSGPYCKVGDNGSYYFVYTSDKGGILSKSGDVIADCIYDRAYNQMGTLPIHHDLTFD